MTPAVATAEPVSIQQAFEQAKAEHSAPQNEPAATEASPDATGAATTPDEAKTEPPVTEAVTPETDDLISDADLASLKTKHGNDPDALAKELKAVFTKKTQALAEQRKSVEALSEYSDFIADLRKDPSAAIAAAAKQLGLTIAPASLEAKATETVTKTTEALADDAVASFRQALGPDLDFLADKLAPAIQAMAQQIAHATVGQAVEPLKAHQDTLLSKAAEEQKASALASFTEKHPDWKQHEQAITALSAKLQPNGMEPLEYLSTLYALATKDIAAAEAAKKAVARMTKAAAADEGKSTAVSEGKVSLARPANPSLKEAFEAAKRGERWN